MRKISLSLAAPIGAFLLTLVVSTIALMAFGSSPAEAYGDMLSHASKLETQVDILNRATPFYLSAVAAAIGSASGVIATISSTAAPNTTSESATAASAVVRNPSSQPQFSRRRLRSSDTGTPAARAKRIASNTACRAEPTRKHTPETCSQAPSVDASRT